MRTVIKFNNYSTEIILSIFVTSSIIYRGIAVFAFPNLDVIQNNLFPIVRYFYPPLDIPSLYKTLDQPYVVYGPHGPLTPRSRNAIYSLIRDGRMTLAPGSPFFLGTSIDKIMDDDGNPVPTNTTKIVAIAIAMTVTVVVY